jgi:4-amino-4-deoxy-L-arabinose transferase-like glycosyltransferase
MPTGLIYALFGPSEFTTVVVSLLASSACVPMLVALGRRIVGSRAALIAGLLLLSFPVHVRYASVLVPEPVMDFWLLAAALAYVQARARFSAPLALATGAIFGMAYLTKEVALFIAAGFILHALAERRWALLGGMLAGLAAVGAVETAVYALFTGDPLWRSHVVQRTQMAYFADSMETASSTWRLFKEYPYEMLVPNIDMGLHSVSTLLCAALGLRAVDGPWRRLLMLWAIVPALYLNFGTASFTTYLPVAAGPRYIEVIYPPLFLLAGIALDRWVGSSPGRRVIGFASLACVATIGLACAYQLRSAGYHTVELGSLRSIARYETSSGRQVTFVTGPRALRWSYSLHLLAERPTARAACVSVGPDAAGLPHVTGLVVCPAAPVAYAYPLK